MEIMKEKPQISACRPCWPTVNEDYDGPVSDVHCELHGLELLERAGVLDQDERTRLQALRRDDFFEATVDLFCWIMMSFAACYLIWQICRWHDAGWKVLG